MGRHRKYTLNETFFDDINTEEKAYFLGYLFADGYNQKTKGTIRLILSTKDENILNKLSKATSSNNPIKKENRIVNGNSYSTSGVYLHSIHMCKTLESHGMTQTKSLTVEFPKINIKYLNHFIRGYFDGDGCIKIDKYGQPKISICGSKMFLIELKKIFECNLNLNSIKLYKSKNSKIHYLEYVGLINVEKIYKLLYSGSNIFLERKYIKLYRLYGDRNISNILNKKGDKLRNKPSKTRTFTLEDVIKIRELKKNNTIKDIAKLYNKTETSISNVLYKKNIYVEVNHHMT